jgi:hypothetical protein
MKYNIGMLIFVSRRRLLVWMAALAVLFSALAPGISHALAAQDGYSVLGEICSVNGRPGFNPAALPVDESQAASDLLKRHMNNCPYCATHGGTFAILPPPTSLSLMVLDGHDLYPHLYYHAPARMFSWAAAQPRGPPFLS